MRMVHIADFDPEKDFEVVVALCGRAGLIWPDATLTPEDFDFVLPDHASRATCPACIVADPAVGVAENASRRPTSGKARC